MKLTRLLALIACIVLALALAETVRAQTKPKDWDALVAAAEKEGQLSIAGPPGDTYRFALIDWFQKKFPKIKVEYNGASGRDQVPRVARERRTRIGCAGARGTGSGASATGTSISAGRLRRSAR